jgi:hypothetical protein
VSWLKSLFFFCLLLLVFLFAALAVNQQQVAVKFCQLADPVYLEHFLVAAYGPRAWDSVGVVL